MLVFLPPIALFIVWKDKKFLKQMALSIFYLSTFIILWHLFNFEFFAYKTGYEPSWSLLRLPIITPFIVISAFAFFLAVYAQYAIIKTEERIRDGADT